MNNWENLRFYLAVARQGTATAAALELRVSHATVLRRIDQLENELGVRLFKRLQTGYELTEVGTGLLDGASALERNIDELVVQCQGQDDELQGPLRVTQPESDTLNLYDLYTQFAERYPGIALQLHSSNAIANLNQQEFDIALRLTDNPPELLVGRCLGPVRFAIYGRQDYLGQFKNRSDLAEFSWIIWTHGQIESRWLNRIVPDASVVLYSSSRTDVLNAIRAGMGVGFVSTQIAMQHSDLVTVPAPRSHGSFKLWMLTHRDLRNQARIKVFMRFMVEAFRGR